MGQHENRIEACRTCHVVGKEKCVLKRQAEPVETGVHMQRAGVIATLGDRCHPEGELLLGGEDRHQIIVEDLPFLPLPDARQHEDACLRRIGAQGGALGDRRHEEIARARMIKGRTAILDAKPVSIGLDDSRGPRPAGAPFHVPPIIGESTEIDGEPQWRVLEGVCFVFGEAVFEVVCHAMRPVDLERVGTLQHRRTNRYRFLQGTRL